MTLKVTQGHWNYLYFIGHVSLPISGLYCRNNDSVWHRFRDITTFAVYVTGCDLEKSFFFEKIVEVTSHASFPIHL